MQYRHGEKEIDGGRASRLPWVAPPAGYVILIQDVAYGNRYKVARHQQLDQRQIKRGAKFPFETRVALILEAENAAGAERDLHNRLAGGAPLGDWFDLDPLHAAPAMATSPPVSARRPGAVALRDLVRNDAGAESLLDDAKVVETTAAPARPRQPAGDASPALRPQPRRLRWAMSVGLLIVIGFLIAERADDIQRALSSLLIEPTPTESPTTKPPAASPTAEREAMSEVFYTTARTISRKCPRLSCARAAPHGAGRRITGRYVNGQKVAGSALWIEFLYKDELRYAQRSALARTHPPETATTPPSPTPRPTRIKATALGQGEVFYAASAANAHLCASRDCAMRDVLPRGAKISALRYVKGQRIGGRDRWIMFARQGLRLYVHSRELSRVRPAERASPSATSTATEPPPTATFTATEPPPTATDAPPTATSSATDLPTATATVMSRTKYVVETAGNANANIRACPRTSCEIVAKFAPGTEVDVLGRVSGETVYGTDEWLEIGFEGGRAFIHSEIVEVPLQSTRRNSTASLTRYASPERKYTHSRLNVRTGPGTHHALFESLPAGTALVVIGKSGDWNMIRRGGRELYVAAWLIHDTPLPASLEPHAGATAKTISSRPSGQSAVVVQVIDGDTIEVQLNGRTLRLRYIGVDTPERGEPCYAEATNYNRSLVQGKALTLVRDTSDYGPYGRLLRYVYADGVFVNLALVQAGYADASYYAPNGKHRHEFEAAQRSAPNRGCLGAPSPSNEPRVASAPVDNCCFIGWLCKTEEEWKQGYFAFQNNQCERSSQLSSSQPEQPDIKPGGSCQASYVKNCTDARSKGCRNIPRGHPAYRQALDRDNDGLGCE